MEQKDASSKESEPTGQPSPIPAISLPKGGGAIRGIGEKFAANPVNGTGSMSVPIATSPGRAGFGPQLSLSYNSGSGNGTFGFGWSLSLPSITRKSDRGLPQYLDGEESDVFIISGAEDLVPALKKDDFGKWIYDDNEHDGYKVRRYRPRIEGLFARIERWTRIADGDQHWRSISKDNILTLYGEDSNSRIANPDDPRGVFSWLICETRDDKGNVVSYKYKPEDGVEVDLTKAHERNRGPRDDPHRKANRHIKRIRYGNRVPLLDSAGRRPRFLTSDEIENGGWMFEVVFDYGEHDPDAPKPYDDEEPDQNGEIKNKWLCRHDPFSSYRAGFEVRTYRLCQRVLMFHHFQTEQDIGQDCLVRSTDFVYRDIRNSPDDLIKGHPVASFVASVTQSGYKRNGAGGYLKKSMPPLEFEYSQVEIQEEVREIDAVSLENMPTGISGSDYHWVDLDGEGISGILTEQAGDWFYKPNLGDGLFGSLRTVAHKPSLATLNAGRQQLLDLAGDGKLDLAEFGGPTPGFFERTHDEDWEQFKPFASLPNIPWDEPNLRFVDLNGNGHADVLITEQQVFTWHPSLAEDGFGPGRQVYQPLDEEQGPRLVFADSAQSIYLADMCGDGLTDLVRIRNGEVCYWPNLGYGRFGARVTTDNAPWFDNPDQFSQQRIRLADIDGSGNNDIIYVGGDGVRVYFNESGNGWSGPRFLSQLPSVDELSGIITADLLGNGTVCLVWSSPLPYNARRPVRYIDLMGGRKPHLLVKTINNMGAETVVQYAPSTRFYLQDKQNGKPWITRLPFPVHCVERVETYDRVSGNRFVSRYKYHHGYFDGFEREFRGFGMVEQWDTEEIGSVLIDQTSSAATNLDAASFVPPIHTKTWFHTGVYLGRDRVTNYFAGLMDAQDVGEYYREPGLEGEDAKRFLLDDTILPDGLTLDEEREACRALKGAMLRQEIYGLDETDKAQHPYTVTEQNFTVERLQPQGANRHSVLFTHAREALSYHYERNPHNPRIGHAMTLEVDRYGNVLKSVAIGYGLEQADEQKQMRTLITYTENDVTNAIDDPVKYFDDYRTPLPSEARTYELNADPATGGYKPASQSGFFQINDFVVAVGEAIEYEVALTGKKPRLIEQVRTLYRKDDLSGLLQTGKLQPLALPGQSYKLAFTAGLLANSYKRNPGEENLLPDPAQVLGGKSEDQGGYVDLDADGCWWIPSGQAFYSITADLANPAATAAAELAEARQHFFTPRRFTDPFDHSTTVDCDAYDLLVVKTEDATQNTATALYDYRMLQPWQMTDPNGNQSEVRFDALGLVVGTAVMGKAAGQVEGDSFDNFVTDLSPEQIKDYLDAANLRPFAVSHLGTATTRIIYDLDRVPACAAIIARETHVSDLAPDEQTKAQLSFVYSDGFGREAQTKIQAEPGLLDPNDPASPVLDPRWVGTGAKIYNNKGKPVRQYEPFFSPSHQFGIEQHGVSSTLFYDPAGRVVAALHPNHTWEKVVFDPWQQTTYDVNDTVENVDGSTDPKSDEDVKGFFSRLPDADYLPTWYEQRIALAANDPEWDAADKAAVHRQTPTVAYLDTLGRAFLTVAHNRFKQNIGGDITTVEQMYPTRVELDIEGNQREVRDTVVQNNNSLERIVMLYDYDMLGNRIHQAGMEAGERWMLNDVTGKPIRAWDSRGFDRRVTYDQLRRPTGMFVTENGVERQTERTAYGESQGATNNHRTRVFQVFDGAGVVTSEAYDFKGNLRQSRRDLLSDYKGEVDWNQNPTPDDGTFTSSTTFDALNRPTTITAPDQSTFRPTYNEANFLDKLDVNLRGAATATPFVTDIDYDAKGQRRLIHYANGATTTYEYDDRTFRLIRLKTTRTPGQNGLASQIFKNVATVQDLRYTYDPAGNITRIADEALPVVVYDNQEVAPVCDYTYDAIYRLIEAGGREHIGQTTFDTSGSFRDYPFAGLGANPNDLQALCSYTERYEYDAAGNFETLTHDTGANGKWTRTYAYEEPSLLESTRHSNRLSSTAGGQTIENYAYDAHGNMTTMPQLTLMRWDFKDQLRATSKQAVNSGTPETTFYVYDTSGQRARKVTERQNGARRDEHIYIGDFEIYREYNSSGVAVTLERETLHVMDDKQRVALVETKTVENGNAINAPVSLQRYQLVNHLGSSSLELDGNSGLISYEEYHPYGTTAFQAMNSAAEVSLKRYRYTGKERDDETGFNYHTARYYAAWLGRWIAADPVGIEAGANLYVYVRNNPIRLIDTRGTEDTPADAKREEKGILKEIGTYLELAFIITVNQTPEEFGQGMLNKAQSLTTDPIMTIYGPEGMIDKAAQKGVDMLMGVPEKDYITEDEHARMGLAAMYIGLSLFPGTGSVTIGLPGPRLAPATGEVAAIAKKEIVVPAAVSKAPAVLMASMSGSGRGSGSKKSSEPVPEKIVVGRGKATTRSSIPDTIDPKKTKTLANPRAEPDFPTFLESAPEKYPEFVGKIKEMLLERLGLLRLERGGLTPKGIDAAHKLLEPGGTLQILEKPIANQTMEQLQAQIKGMLSPKQWGDISATVHTNKEGLVEGLLITAKKL